MKLHKAARRYVENGWAVFPVRPGSKTPATAHGCKDATTELPQVDRWWSREEYNIGVATGAASGIWVLDVDGDTGMEGLLSLGYGLPGTLTQHTPSGGVHFVFLDPGGLGNTASTVAPGVDTRGDGGYIVVAPSVHPNGGRYQWGGRQHPDPVPGWLLRTVTKPPVERKRVTPKGDVHGYVDTALRNETERVASAPVGTRNDTLNRAGFSLGTLVGAGVLDREHAYRELSEAASACGLSGREIERTLDAALSAGAEHPREVAA